jgi:hypothetical protein
MMAVVMASLPGGILSVYGSPGSGAYHANGPTGSVTCATLEKGEHDE